MKILSLFIAVLALSACSNNSSNDQQPNDNAISQPAGAKRIVDFKVYKTLPLATDQNYVQKVVFSRSGDKIAVSGDIVSVFSLSPWKLELEINQSKTTMGFSEDGEFLNLSYFNSVSAIPGRYHIGKYDLRTKKRAPEYDDIRTIADTNHSFTQNGQYAIYPYFDTKAGTTLHAYNFQNKNMHRDFYFKHLEASSLSDNGQSLAIIESEPLESNYKASNYFVRLLNFQTGQLIYDLMLGEPTVYDPILRVQISADGTQLAYCQTEKKVFIYNVSTKKTVQLDIDTCGIDFDFSRDGQFLAVTAKPWEKAFFIFDVTNGQVVSKIEVPYSSSTPSFVSFSPNSEYLFLSSGGSKNLVIYKIFQDTPDFPNPAPVQPPTPGQPPVQPNPNESLSLVIENAQVMNQPEYLLAKKNGNNFKLYFLKNISDDRKYLLCSDNLNDIGIQETVGRIAIPAAPGLYDIPSVQASANVNVDSIRVYTGFAGQVKIDSVVDGAIKGRLDLKATSANGSSKWTGPFQAMTCSEEQSFFRSKNLDFTRKRVSLKSASESVSGFLTIKSSNGLDGLGGNLEVTFQPDKVTGTDYYPSGFHFETQVRLFGGRMHNQSGQLVGEYSKDQLFYSTKNGAYTQLVDPFDLKIDYTNINDLKIQFVTPKSQYRVVF
jgi:WD40 repeat protein